MFNFAIIGCGVIAPSHVQAIKEAGNSAKLYAVCDIIEDKAIKFKETHGAEKVYIDYKDMLADSNVDVVCICTPSGMHGEMTINAARAGKHILCEKPIEITAKKMKAVIDVVEKSGVNMACVFQRRTQPIAVKVKEAIDNGEFGKVLVADAYMKSWRSKEYYKSADWRATWELDGGGALMNQGIHGIDLISWFCGGIDSVKSIVRTRYHDIAVEDAAVVAVEYKNGAIGVIQGTTCVYPGQDVRFEIHCEKGSIIFTDNGILLWGDKGYEASGEGSGVKDNPAALGSLSHTPILLDLIDAIKNNRPPMVTPAEGRKAVDTILAIYQSSKTGKAVKLK